MISCLSEAQEKIDAARDRGADSAEINSLRERAIRDADPFKDELLYPALIEKLNSPG